ncbi:hypothetical protein PPACK8108_LOCUS12603, partial [Phakopsora pachyrhizi]
MILLSYVLLLYCPFIFIILSNFIDIVFDIVFDIVLDIVYLLSFDLFDFILLLL